MFNDVQNYNTQNNQHHDVIDFLTEIAKDAVSIKNDLDFQDENRRVLVNWDVYDIVRRIGRTEERFETEMGIYIKMLEVEKTTNSCNSSYHAPMYNGDLEKYRHQLSLITERIPEFIAIKYGKEKITGWALDKMKEIAKQIVSRYGQNGRWG
jgi:hypothetical protein